MSTAIERIEAVHAGMLRTYRLTDVYGRKHLVGATDWERGRVQTPLRNSLGVKLGDTRPYEQKVCPTIHRDNVVKVEAGPWLPTD
jgi:hypothetical protein